MVSHRRRIAGYLAVALLASTAGCSAPPWEQAASPAPPGSTSGSAPSGSAPAGTVTPSPTSESVENDLAKGSLKRTLTAGAAELSVTYWSTLDLAAWTPQVPKPLNVVASASLDGGVKGQDVFLSAVRVATTAYTTDGSPQSLEVVEDTADVEPGYLITKPSSFQQVFTLPPAPDGSTAVQLTVTYELLIESAPDSETYLRQATSDTIRVPLAS